MTQHEKDLHASLPENLRQKFAALEKRLWKIETATAVCFALTGLALAFLALFVSDRFWDSPVWLRVLISASSLATLASPAVWWLKRWVLQRRDLETFAQLVQKKFSRLGDRLLGIVELSGERRHTANFSPELYHAAIQQVAGEAERFDFSEAVDSRRAKKFVATTISLAAVVLVLFAVAFDAGKNVLLRWLAPTARVERYTFVHLAGLPDKLIIPHGEPFAVAASVEYRSFWKPSRASARLERQAKIGGDVKNSRASFSIPGQLQATSLRIKIGDAEKIVAIEPTHRPTLRELSAAIQLPDYLKREPLEETVRGGALTILEGSRVAFRGSASRELRDAKLGLDGKDFSPLKIEGGNFSSDPLKRDGIFQAVFSWQDMLGLTNAPPLRLVVQTKPDSPPQPQFVDVGRDVAMLFTDVLEIKTLVQDDFGVRSVGLSWEVATSAENADSFGVSEVRKEVGSARETKVEKSFSWSPVAFRIPPDSAVELTAFARDFFPERERAYSSPVRIYVLGNEKHAEMVRQKLDFVLARLDEVSRLEEKIAANTEALQAMTNSPQSAEKLEGVKNDQQRNAAHLEELAKEGVRTMQEALKNPLFNEKVFTDWSKNLQAMQQVARQQMRQAAESLDAAKQSSAQQNSEQRQQNLATAKQKEDEALEALAKMQEQINKNLDDLQALTLSHRLRQVASAETDIETGLQKSVSETIGLLPRELPEKFKRVNAALAAVQTNAQAEAGTLQKEISRFYERTKKQNYGDVSDEMVEQKVVDRLEHVRGLILENVAMEASRNSATWAVKFTDWAEKLEPKEYCKGGGDGKGEGKTVDMRETLIALLKLRQSEISLRGQTTLLDEQRGHKDYKKSAKELLSTQTKLTGEFHNLLVENTFPQLDEVFSDTQNAMRETEKFLGKPQTDTETVATQTRAIDSLTDLINLINEQAKRSKKSAGESESERAEDMSMLMQMAKGNQVGQGMPSEKSGSGNTRGGTTDRAPGAANGEASGKSPGERKVARASGAVKNAPVEFRDALENYFKAVEEGE